MSMKENIVVSTLGIVRTKLKQEMSTAAQVQGKEGYYEGIYEAIRMVNQAEHEIIELAKSNDIE